MKYFFEKMKVKDAQIDHGSKASVWAVFLYGIPASILLMVVVGLATFILWPLMGMPVTLH